MSGGSCLRGLFKMASEAIGTPAADSRPTKYYFAYGSNLHLRQMKRRCPGSKFIGCARLSHYRWQINERGYANVVEAEGHWVDGLVYEIDEEDEARLDINEGVSKNAYTKRYMTVLLNRAHSPLYRRPTAWIVDKGGPAKVRLLAQNDGQKESEHPQHWEQNVLVYISLNYVVDSKPKDEYIKRINFGVNDAKALGVGDDYGVKRGAPQRSGDPSPSRKSQAPPQRSTTPNPTGRTPAPAHRTGTPSPARRTQAVPRPANPSPQRMPPGHRLAVPNERRRAQSEVGCPPPLPPRPTRRMQSIPVIVVDDRYVLARLR
ncbi:Gamma-glutamylcyclotransferase-like protein [Ilyonectria robusta]